MGLLIYGGSFDPPHQGHLALLTAALDQTGAQAVVVPSHQNPLKPIPGAPAADRLRMLDIALRGLPSRLRGRVSVSRFEISRGRLTYTYETLAHLRKSHPGASLGLLLGSDCLDQFRHWKRWKEILESCSLVLGRRPGFRTPAPKGAEVVWLRGSFPPLSSSGVREALGSGEELRLPSGLLEHIERRSLYDRGIHRWLRQRLRPERYAHTLAVIHMARRLAHRHGLSPERARKAALLHDAGRTLPVAGLTAYCRRNSVQAPLRSEMERRNPLLLHAYVGADIARRRFGVAEPAVLSAIRNHTLGAPHMPELDRMLYVADLCSEDRPFREAERLRVLAFEDLAAALQAAVETKLRYVLSQGGWLHPQGVALWNSLQNRR